ncbi:MAG: hypothetical protein K6G88_10315 [Lachnospiraceae bacterium]|nr:hypothetical protein [Lachnospiraceae bacterium]
MMNDINGISEDIMELLLRGKKALDEKDWETASLLFSKAITVDDKCGDAYYGAWLANNHANSVKSMIKVFVDKYSNPSPVAVEYYRDHINEMVKEYQIPGYLTDEDIMIQYDFCSDSLFYSTAESCAVMKEQAMKEIAEEKLWVKAREYGTKELHDKVDYIIEEIERTLTERADEAEDDYIRCISEIVNAIGQKVLDADKVIIERSNEAIEERFLDYKKAVLEFKYARKKSDYDQLILTFKKCGEYKDSEEYIKKCIKKRKRAWIDSFLYIIGDNIDDHMDLIYFAIFLLALAFVISVKLLLRLIFGMTL